MRQLRSDWMQKYLLPVVVACSYLVMIPIATYATYRGFYYLDGDAIKLSISSLGVLGGLTIGILSFKYGGD
ncbi:MAG TPA: hypothetical protein VNM40_03300 [Candidatus Paceibacterota bacterium]|nr:hypothetical protein [Candidatus Paceibacterota bacterium]